MRAAVLLAFVALVPVRVLAAAPDVGSPSQREAGRVLYSKYCSQCHGEKGDGEGYAAFHLLPKPRNFTTAKFKIRTTPNGALPTHQDLINVIRHGMPYTSMPSWPNFSNEQVSDLAYFVTTFSPDFSNPDLVPQQVPLPRAPHQTKESIEQGKKLYVDNGCVRCHGTLGRGDGPSAPTLVDDLGNPIRAADLTQNWTFRGGSTREDVFRTMSTGLNGTPMPSFLDALKDDQRWAIADYIDSLSGGNKGPGYATILIARHVDDPIDVAKGAAAFASAPAARFPLVGQIMEPTRNFHPPVTSVVVQAIYDSDNVAFLVRWHDRSAEKTGHNGPSLPVPIEEEGTPSAGAGGAPSGGGDVWGGQAAPENPAEAGSPQHGSPQSGSAQSGSGNPAQAGSAQPANPFAEAETPAAAPSEFSDAVAIQFPSQIPTTARKPYFIFGDAQNPVDLWYFDLARSEPQQFTARGSGDVAANDTGDLSGAATYDQGEWSVIFKRPLRATSGVAFAAPQFVPIAFSVWDGLTRERGSKRALTVWYNVYVEPEAVPSAIGPMIRTALLVLVIELLVIGLVRRSVSAQASEPLVREQVPQAPSGS
jgi:mono/diheme cytochrome c family protein